MEITLPFSPDGPPLSVLAAAKIAAISVSTDPNLPPGSTPVFRFSSGMELHGTNVLLRYLGWVATLPNFYGLDALESAQIDEWLE